MLLPGSLAIKGSLRIPSHDAILQHTAQDVSQSLASSLGCYGDKDDRLFDDKITDGKMTPARCEEHCEGYAFFGLQYGVECWCGREGTDYTKYGEASCDMDCGGDSGVTCGGSYALNIYSMGSVSDDPGSIGCYGDSKNDRIFSNKWEDYEDMGPNRCARHCLNAGAVYYGTQYGSQCWCGDGDAKYDRHGPAKCNMPCSGVPDRFCGGYDAMSVYVIDSSPTPISESPTPAPVRTTSPSPTETKPTPPPTPVWEMPEYEAGCTKASWRYASGTGPSGRAYIEGSGLEGNECFTLTDLYIARDGKAPLYVTDVDGNELPGSDPTGYWLLKGELYVIQGAILYVHGTDAGGDADILRIQSNDNELFHEVRGYGGSLSFKSTKVISWDTDAGNVREDYEGGRSFLNCVSEKLDGQTCEGKAKNDAGICRMDIIDSEMGYLGYFDSESYGLTWKVRGFCVDKSNPEVFDNTDVFGDIKGSDIHHMYYGMYSYGHQGGVWTNNKMHDNHQYGFDPHDDSDYLTISHNTVWNNVNHGIIASKRCNNVKIYDNEVYDGGAQAAGIFLHRSTDSCEVYNNYVHDMYDAGLANLESFDSKVYDNIFENVKYGIRISLGGGNNEVYDNTFKGVTKYGLYTYKGSDPPEVSEDGRPENNIFHDNTVICAEDADDAAGVKFKEADGTMAFGNDFQDCHDLQFLDATETSWYDNAPGDACLKSGSSTFSEAQGLPPACS